MPGSALHGVGAHTVKEGFGIRTLNADLAECRLVEDCGALMRLLHLVCYLRAPFWPTQGEFRLGGRVEIERPLPAIDLPEMRPGGSPFGVERRYSQMACRGPLASRKGDLIMLAEHLRHARREGGDAVEGVRKATRIEFGKI